MTPVAFSKAALHLVLLQRVGARTVFLQAWRKDTNPTATHQHSYPRYSGPFLALLNQNLTAEAQEADFLQTLQIYIQGEEPVNCKQLEDRNAVLSTVVFVEPGTGRCLVDEWINAYQRLLHHRLGKGLDHKGRVSWRAPALRGPGKCSCMLT